MSIFSTVRDRLAARVLYARALAALDGADFARSRELALRALALWPDCAFCHWILATAAQRSGDLDAAATHLEKARQIQPERVDYCAQMAVIRFQQERWEEAAALFAEAGTSYASHSYAHARCFLELRRYSEARDSYESLLRLRPGDLAVRFDLGVCCLELGRAEDALEHFRYVESRDPKRAGLSYNLAQALRQLGREQESLEEARQAAATDPDDADAHTLLGQLLLDAGFLAESVSCYQRAADLCPESAGARVNLAYAWTANGRTDQAQVEYRRALKLDGSNPDAFYGLALLAWEREDLSAALTYGCKAHELRPSDVQQTLLLAELCEACQDYSKARRYFAEAADLGAVKALERLRQLPRG